MQTYEMTGDDAAQFREIIQRAGFEHVHTWNESHGCQTDMIYQRPVRAIATELPCAREEIVVTRRIDNYDGRGSISFYCSTTIRHDYLLAKAILRELQTHPEEWVQPESIVEACCTAGSTRYERCDWRGRARFCLVEVARHGTWAYEEKAGGR
jgi:hypothetical protein